MGTLRIGVRGGFSLERNISERPFLFEMGLAGKHPGSLRRVVEISERVFEIELFQKRRELFVKGVPKELSRRVREKISFCLGVNDDFSEFLELAEKDKVLFKFIPRMKGLRLFSSPSKWETLSSIVLSQMTSFSQYKRMVYSLYSAYGKFPSQKDIILRPKPLSKAKAGYREKFILSCARKFDGKSLEGLFGVGNYTKDIFRLFGEREFSSVYDDVLMRRILRERYGGASIGTFKKRWGSWGGVAEVFLQKFLSDNPAGRIGNVSGLGP